MPLSSGVSKVLGVVVGVLLLIAALVAVFVLKKGPEPVEEPIVIRPLKTLVVGQTQQRDQISLPGRVSAGQEAEVSFEVPGRLIELPVMEGDPIKRGDLIAVLDPSDYQNALDAAIAQRDRAKAQLDRMEKALQTNAVSKQEFDNARAAFDVAAADVKTRTKAREDTRVFAQFDGVIAERYVSNFESVNAKQAIVSLQNLDQIEVVANVPEKHMTRRETDVEPRTFATFEYLPGRAFEMRLKEFAAEADPRTQTFLVTLVMDKPEDVQIWPGMSATVHVEFPDPPEDDGLSLTVPMDVVVIDGTGTYHVWLLTDHRPADNTYAVRKTPVTPGRLDGGTLTVTQGIAAGDLIAGAGVNLLTEGQRVTRHQPPADQPGAGS